MAGETQLRRPPVRGYRMRASASAALLRGQLLALALAPGLALGQTPAGTLAAGEPAVPVASAARGDAQRGRGVAETCVPCHGAAGISESAAFPIIAGQQYDYLVSAMQAYLSGARQDSIMGGALRTLSPAEIADVAAYYASLRGLAAATPVTANADSPAPPVASVAPVTPGAAAASGGAPAGAFAAAQAAAEAARALQRPAPRRAQQGRDPDAAERRACAAAAAAAGVGDHDSDGDGVADRDDAAPADPTGFAVDADGDGFAAICNAGQLRAIGRGGEAQWRRNFELVADIDLGGAAFEPIGNCGPANNCMISRDRFAYAAHFDGNGHTIRGLRLELPDAGGVGLFGTLGRTGAVTRLVLRDAEVQGANGAGLLVGASFGIIDGCDVQGTVRGRVAIGGIAGGNAGRVLNSRAEVRLEAMAAAGGLVGDMNGTVESSTARVSIDGGKGAGGLVGLSTYGSVVDSRARGSVRGIDNVGGLVGVNTDALLEGSEANVTVEGTGTNAGGAVGYSAHSVLRNVIAHGAVNGRNAVGGLVGRNRGAILHAYSTGRVTGEASVGGLVGDNSGGTLRGAYWDSTRSGITAGAGLARTHEQLLALSAGPALWDGADRPCSAAASRDRAPAPRGARAAPRTIWMFDPGRDYPRLGCLPGEPAP